jgi:two-component system, chemotaxis family, protein-glutamate methylesterase/glutaminase
MSPAQRRRVLVVEDSLTVRKRIVEVLSTRFDVVGEAADGRAAIDLCERLRPDAMTMDIMMPTVSGLAATEHIMAYCPTPILIVSASTNRGEIFKTYDALAAGAVDVLEKPLGDEPDGDWERRLVAALETVARIPVITHPRVRLRASRVAVPAAPSTTRPIDAAYDRVIAIGASTGGPRAVLTVLRELPADFPLPILLVIHIAEPFGTALAEWLDSQVAPSVRYARDGELLAALPRGSVLMATPGRHLQIRRRRVQLTTEAERHSCRPSVDVLFESLASEYRNNALGCLLTGMGKDGATGLAAIRAAGGTTLAQDAATSVVFGMPGEAVRIGAAGAVVPLDEIAAALLRWTHSDAQRERAS